MHIGFPKQEQIKPSKLKGSKKNKFTEFEDEHLRQIISEVGIYDWETVAQRLGGRSPRQCRDRWNYYLNPKVKNRPWTQAEDYILIEKYLKFGPKWAVLCQFFDSRTDANVKNHFLVLERRLKKDNQLIAQEQQRQINEKIDKILDENAIFNDADLWASF